MGGRKMNPKEAQRRSREMVAWSLYDHAMRVASLIPTNTNKGRISKENAERRAKINLMQELRRK